VVANRGPDRGRSGRCLPLVDGRGGSSRGDSCRRPLVVRHWRGRV